MRALLQPRHVDPTAMPRTHGVEPRCIQTSGSEYSGFLFPSILLTIFRRGSQSLGFQRSSLSKSYPTSGILITTFDAKDLVEEAGPWFWDTWNG